MAHVADRLTHRRRAGPFGPLVSTWSAIDPGWRGTSGLMWVALLMVVALGIAAPARRTGDAHQYHAMAGSLASLRPPALSASETAAYKSWLRSQPSASGFPGGVRAVDQPALVREGRQEFSHFWAYPLLAAPFVVAVDRLGLHRAYAFLIVNALLLAMALWAIGRWSRPVVGLLLLASPLVWFVDKAQVEVFTVAFLGLAIVAAGRQRFLWAALFAAVASTQNLPIAGAVPLFWAAGIATKRASRIVADDRAGSVAPDEHELVVTARPVPKQFRTSAGLIGATLVVVALHPGYYLWRLGVVTPQELNGGIAAGLPSLGGYLAIVIDPNLGLIPWAPFLVGLAVMGAIFLVAPGGGASAARIRSLRPAAICAAVLGAWFLLAFSQTSNVNSGGTVHVSRYALWLLPLLIPFLEAVAWRLDHLQPAVLPLAGMIVFICYLILFRPGQPERYVAPSPQAELFTTWLPRLSVLPSVPEIFFERQQGADGGVTGSAANRTCSVLLLTEGAEDPPCSLTTSERASVSRLFGEGWATVWVTRPGRLGVGGTQVMGAARR